MSTSMKRSHVESSTALVIQPRRSLGGNGGVSGGGNGAGGAMAMAAAVAYEQQQHKEQAAAAFGAVPPRHRNHPRSALDAGGAGSTRTMGVLARSHSGAITSSGSGSGVVGGGGGAINGGGGAASAEVLLSGMLTKRGHFFRTWLPRYFILTRSTLCYYRKNPAAVLVQEKESGAIERRLLRGEIHRSDVLRVERSDVFKNRPFSFVLVLRKRSHYARASKRSSLACMFVHHKETRLRGVKTEDGPVLLYYMDAPSEDERRRWMRAIQSWMDCETPAKLGRAIFDYIVNNEYSSYRYEQKVGDFGDAYCSLNSTGNGESPAAQAGRMVEEDHAVLANLIRDMHECRQEDEMIFILDQILGEVKDGAASGYIKKLISSAGEVKLETSPRLWTEDVKATYGNIMKALYTKAAAAPTQLRSTSNRSKTLRPMVVAPTRQASDGGQNAPEFSFHRSYKMGRKLGSGAYSVVHIATNRSTRKQVAVKCISKASLSSSDVISLKHEVEIMSTLDHPNVVPLLDYYEEERYYYLVTPLCTGGELFDTLVKRKSYTEEDARILMQKLTSAIMYIHSRGIVHRDLKPENILLKTSAPGAEVMIADFGFARSMRGEKRLTACGTPGYVAPEVVRGEAYGSEVDCWSLGVILFILLCGYPPFAGDNHAAIFERVVVGNYKFASPEWDDVSEEARDLVTKLLAVDRAQRFTATDVLNHAWMNPLRLSSWGNDEEKSRIVRVNSDLLPVLNQMRNNSLTHDIPKIRPSDMDVDVLELSRLSVDFDVDFLDRELAVEF